jgi:hypothetical protein
LKEDVTWLFSALSTVEQATELHARVHLGHASLPQRFSLALFGFLDVAAEAKGIMRAMLVAKRGQSFPVLH